MIDDLVLARLCAQTYVPPWHFIKHARGTVHYQVHQMDGRTVLAIQGTQNRAQAILDANAVPRRSRAQWWAHTGFLGAAEALEPMVRRHLRGPIMICGHSLGGAVATALAGLLLESRDPDQIEVVGFGSPRVGMAGLCRALDPVHVRLYRNGHDIVPTLPWPFPLPYRHVTPLIPVGDSSLGPINDHGIARYIAALDRS